MSTKWYHSHKGQPLGPFSDDAIEEMILARKLGSDDLVFLEGNPKWQPVSEIARFSEALSRVKPDAEPAVEASLWIALVKDNQGRRLQKGPFKTKDLRKKILEGDISLSDYVWRHGMRNWYRIQSFPELVEAEGSDKAPPLPDSKKGDLKAKITDDDRTELLKNVLELKTVVGPDAKSLLPPELEGPDLVEYGSDPRDISVPEIGSATKVKLPWHVKATAKATLEPSGALTRVLQDKRTYRYLGVMVAVVLLWQSRQTVIDRVSARLKSLNGPKVTQLIPSKTVKDLALPEEPQSKVAEAPVQSTASEELVKNARPVSTPPKYVKLFVRNGELQISTDASSDFLSILSFVSEPGEIIGSSSYSKMLQREGRNLDLQGLKWPIGTYRVTVRVGEIEAKTKVFVGSKPSDFTQRLKVFNKGLTYSVIKERIELIKTTKLLVDELKIFQAILSRAGDSFTWDRDYGPWRSKFRSLPLGSIQRVGSKSRDAYFFATTWLELQFIKKEIDAFISRMARPSERTRQDSMVELRGYLSRLQMEHEAAQSYSLWK